MVKAGFLEQFTLISTIGLWLILSILSVPLLVRAKLKRFSVGIMYFVKEIALIKFVSYSVFKGAVNSDVRKALRFGDAFIFKPRQFKFPTPKAFDKFTLYIIIGLRFVYWYYYCYSISLIRT